MGFWTGDKERWEQKSRLGPEQQSLYDQLLRSSQGPGGSGSFGQAADYYRDLLSNDSQTFNQMAAPEMRRFREDIIPGLSEQFAGMGSGGLSSSGFRNAGINAGTDLSERLGAMRAQLRQQGAAGLSGLAQQGLGNFNQNIFRPGNEGFLGSTVGPLLGTVAGSFLGPVGAAAGGALGKRLFGKSSPYGDDNAAGPYGDGQTYNPYTDQMR